ncbi:MAG: PilZ domain-containing protein [Acidobacteriota bacterium]
MTEQQDDRRQYERVRVNKPVKLEATLRGRFIDIMRLEMSGVTIDMSRGGFLANVDQSISPGVRCRVDLEDSEGTAEPESLWARVRRASMSRDGFVVALEFDEPIKAQELLGGGKEPGAEVKEFPQASESGPGAVKKKPPRSRSRRKSKR